MIERLLFQVLQGEELQILEDTVRRYDSSWELRLREVGEQPIRAIIVFLF